MAILNRLVLFAVLLSVCILALDLITITTLVLTGKLTLSTCIITWASGFQNIGSTTGTVYVSNPVIWHILLNILFLVFYKIYLVFIYRIVIHSHKRKHVYGSGLSILKFFIIIAAEFWIYVLLTSVIPQQYNALPSCL